MLIKSLSTACEPVWKINVQNSQQTGKQASLVEPTQKGSKMWKRGICGKGGRCGKGRKKAIYKKVQNITANMKRKGIARYCTQVLHR